MKKRLMNNIGLKILAFFAAALLWLAVVNIDDPTSDQTFSNIPVSVINEQILTTDQNNRQTYQIMDDTQKVSVKVTAKRSILNKISAEDIMATADMKELTLKTQVPISITINKHEGDYVSAVATPRNMQIKLEKEGFKKIPITPTTTGTVRDGYILGEIKANPEKVSIRGPESVVNSISRVTAEVSVSGLSEDAILQTSMVLYDADNREIDQTLLTNNLGTQGVSVSVQLLPTKSVSVEFDTSAITAASGYSFKEIKYEPQQIHISGESQILNRINTIKIPAEELKINDVSEKIERMVDITPYLPEDVQLADENAGTVIVTILVDRDGTKSYEMMVSAITVKNLSDSLKLTYDTAESLDVQISGREDVLDALTIDTIKADIDLKDYTKPGSYEVPVNIELPAGCTLEKAMTVKIALEDKTKN